MVTRRIGSWLAIFAMLSQVVFGAAHAAAMAAAAFGPLKLGAAPRASFGLLQICTANGLIQIRPDGQTGGKAPGQSSAEDRCPVCSSASVSPFTSAPATMIVAAAYVHVVISPPRNICARVSCLSRDNPIRGPPAS